MLSFVAMYVLSIGPVWVRVFRGVIPLEVVKIDRPLFWLVEIDTSDTLLEWLLWYIHINSG